MTKELKDYIPRMIEYSKRGFPIDKIYCDVKDQLEILPMIYWECYIEIFGRKQDYPRKKINAQRRTVERLYREFIRRKGKVDPRAIRARLDEAGILKFCIVDIKKAFPYPDTTIYPFCITVPGIGILVRRLKETTMKDMSRTYRATIGLEGNQYDLCGIRLDIFNELVCNILNKNVDELAALVERCRTGPRSSKIVAAIFCTLFEAKSPMTADDVAGEVGMKASIIRLKLLALLGNGFVEKIKDRPPRYYITGSR